jgi:MFS family permease
MSERKLPQTVIALGWVSLLADVASEMTYPILPLFLSTALGAGPAAIGLIEGFADATSSFLKLFSGVVSDRARRKKPLILLGYSLSSFAKPAVGLATVWGHVFIARFADRVGKGLRTSPRDALISQVTDPAIRGAAYGFHRAMDHTGAAIGPLIGLALVGALGVGLRNVFFIAAIPATIAIVVLATAVRESDEVPSQGEAGRASLRLGWVECGPEFRKFLLSVVLFALGNSTDAFLLWRLGEAGVGTTMLFILWSLHHVVKMAATAVGGRMSDRVGRKPMILSGWALYAAIYLGFGLCSTQAGLIALFLAYGVFFGLTEPVEKAMVADLTPPRLRGTAFGLFHFATGIAILPASVVFGVLYQVSGALAAFGFGAVMAGIAGLLLTRVRPAS